LPIFASRNAKTRACLCSIFHRKISRCFHQSQTAHSFNRAINSRQKGLRLVKIAGIISNVRENYSTPGLIVMCCSAVYFGTKRFLYGNKL